MSFVSDPDLGQAALRNAAESGTRQPTGTRFGLGYCRCDLLAATEYLIEGHAAQRVHTLSEQMDAAALGSPALCAPAQDYVLDTVSLCADAGGGALILYAGTATGG